MISEVKQPRKSLPPTQFQKFEKKNEIEFSGNWSPIIGPKSSESACLTESVSIFPIGKTPTQKRSSDFNPGIQPRDEILIITTNTNHEFVLKTSLKELERSLSRTLRRKVIFYKK